MESPGDERSGHHAAEPWRQEGRYIRDATGAIIVRGRSEADARRIVAAINGTRGIPTEALERWSAEDVSNPATRPDLEVDLEDETPSPFAVRPPVSDDRFRLTPPEFPVESLGLDVPKPLPFDRRIMERRRGERRRT
jgi:hypothetical protein